MKPELKSLFFVLIACVIMLIMAILAFYGHQTWEWLTTWTLTQINAGNSIALIIVPVVAAVLSLLALFFFFCALLTPSKTDKEAFYFISFIICSIALVSVYFFLNSLVLPMKFQLLTTISYYGLPTTGIFLSVGFFMLQKK